MRGEGEKGAVRLWVDGVYPKKEEKNKKEEYGPSFMSIRLLFRSRCLDHHPTACIFSANLDAGFLWENEGEDVFLFIPPAQTFLTSCKTCLQVDREANGRVCIEDTKAGGGYACGG